MELINRTNFLLELLLFMERNGILFQKVYLLDHIIKSDNGMFLFTFHSSFPVLLPIRIADKRWLRKTGAFDKKQSQTPGDHHGSSNLGLGFGLPLPIGMGMGMDEDREGSPTPQSGRGKKRRGSEE